jgi:hypothetical protein
VSSHRITMLSGGVFDFKDMEDSSYTIEDIAHNLSMICRFTGSVSKHYSVSQHSVLVSRCVPPEHALSALMHDMSEAVMSDINSPLKALLPQYKAFEKKVEKFMFGRMGLPFPMHPSIKLADISVFLAENRDLRGIESYWAGVEAYSKRIIPWQAEKAKREFLKRYEELTQ